MMTGRTFGLLLALALPLTACDDSDSLPNDTTPTGTTTSTTGAGGTGGTTASAGGGGTGGGTGGQTASCDAERDLALAPIDLVSTGEVSELSASGTTKTLYIDASAGGQAGAPTQPWIYVNLASASRVDVTDPASLASKAWDLGLERALVRTNSGDGGPGDGGAAQITGKAFSDVTAADAAAATIEAETWFDAECKLQTDAADSMKTTFHDWYDYDPATHSITPKDLTYVVRAADGALYKLHILDYYATPDGGSGKAGGKYKIEVAPLM